MASGMPLPPPPRTPSPHKVQIREPRPLSRDFDALKESYPDFFDPSKLSPMVDTPDRPNHLSPSTANHLERINSGDSLNERNPFNFQTATYTPGRPPSPVKSNVGQRRGHRYKHSSISFQIFQEPEPRAPLQLPASLPIPTMKEGRASMSRNQNLRAVWCVCHLLVAGHVQWSSQGSMAMTALSHLIFYDAMGAVLCAVVDILSNFEVWKRSSIRQPFGLERSEVLVGFAMSILLLFMGFDLITHDLHHALEGLGGHEPHREHSHARVSPGSIDIAALLAISSSLVSAIMLQNHKRIAKAMQFDALAFLPSILNNPSHLLTLSCSALLLLMPLLSLEMYSWLDRALSGAIALSMLVLGSRLVWNLGTMLLMSYSDHGIPEVKRDIATDPSVVALDEASFWQVHYGLCLANLKLRVRGTDDSLARLRERMTSLIRQRLGGGYGAGGQKWEVAIQLTLEKD